MTHLGRWISALVDEELDDAERDHVLNHLARCEPCLREVNSLRALKRRMGGLGDAGINDRPSDPPITSRLLGLAGPSRPGTDPDFPGLDFPGVDFPGPGFPGPDSLGPADRWALSGRQVPDGLPFGARRPGSRRNWTLIGGAVAVGLTAVGAAAFFLGGTTSSPAPRITPAVDAYWTQHGFDTGQAPARAGDGGLPGSRPLP